MQVQVAILTLCLAALPTSVANVSDGTDMVQSQLLPVHVVNASRPLMKPWRADADDDDSMAQGKKHRHGRRQHRKGHGNMDAKGNRCDDFPMDTWEGNEYSISQKSSRNGALEYTYTIKVGVSINQQTSDAGKYHLGDHESFDGRTEEFVNGKKCGKTPRSATVTYTFGSEPKLLSASEPSMCKYVFEVQLPESDCPTTTTTTTTTLACDEVDLDSYAGTSYTLSQESSLHGNALYTYTIEIGGAIKQQTSNAGNYHLGDHQSFDGRTEEFVDGQKCGSTPRSATVTYTFGPKAEMLSANEVSTCKYKFEIQLPYAAEAFAGRTYEVSQLSTLHQNAEYTYAVEIGGEIKQHTSNAGSYLIGKHQSYAGTTEKFINGDRCGSIARSATVTYTYGAETKLLSANEVSTCKYVFRIQLPEGDCR